MAPVSGPRPGSRAPTRIRTSPSRRSSLPGSTGSNGPSRCRRRWKATPTSRTPTDSRTRSGRRSPPSKTGRSRAALSATRWSTTTSTTREPSRSSSTGSSRRTSARGCSSVARPVIGITAYAEPSVRWGVWDVPAAVIPLAYVRQVEAAGGRAVIVPPSEEGIEETLDALDGVLFSGGSDIDPSEYGQDAHPETNGTRPERDRGELALLRAALDRDLPVLAVCRGSQVLNVARGGDLVQHLPDVVGD